MYEWQNLQAGQYALGIEPSTNHVLGQAVRAISGELIWLEHGDERATTRRSACSTARRDRRGREAHSQRSAEQPEEDYPQPSGKHRERSRGRDGTLSTPCPSPTGRSLYHRRRRRARHWTRRLQFLVAGASGGGRRQQRSARSGALEAGRAACSTLGRFDVRVRIRILHDLAALRARHQSAAEERRRLRCRHQQRGDLSVAKPFEQYTDRGASRRSSE